MVVIDYGKWGAKLARDLLYKSRGLDKLTKV
jgi:hypothetical protein